MAEKEGAPNQEDEQQHRREEKKIPAHPVPKDPGTEQGNYDLRKLPLELEKQNEELRRTQQVLEGLRQQAEKQIEVHPRHKNKATEKLLYELKVQQIELEMQNENLRTTQQELEASWTRYFDLYNLAPVGYCTIDSQGKILDANLTAATLFGVPRGTLVNQSITRFIFPEDQDLFARERQQLFESGMPRTWELRTHQPDATTIWVRMEANLAHCADGTPLCRIVISDITSRKQMEEALRRSENKYRTVADFTYDWEFWLGPDGDYLYCSPSCARITGLSAAAFQNDPSLLRALVHPDDLAAFDQHLDQEAILTQKIGQEFEFRIIRAHGSIRWIWVSHVCQPVFDDQGQFLGTRGNIRDVTERKRLEAENVKERNLASLGVLAGGIAHDFNNLFQGLFGNIALAKMHTEESSKAFPLLEKAEQVFGLATRLTGQLIAFSSGGTSIPLNIPPAKYIKEEISSVLADSGLEVEFNLADNLCLVNIDPTQFRDVIKHMVLNAKEAMSSQTGCRLMITAVNETLQQTGGKHPTIALGDYVKISIQDQGCGIGREDLPRIFDPYFSTKQRGSQKGMGLGLALCEAIIRKQGGAITVKSQPGNGTIFHIYIPAVVAAAKRTEVAKDTEVQGPRILLMDDELGVVQVVTEFLRFAGYRVDSTVDGEATVHAYKEAREAGDPYAVVILDLIIPGGMGGREVVAILREIDPEVKAIVSSGYANDPAMIDFAGYGFVAACAKPYLFAELKEMIERFI